MSTTPEYDVVIVGAGVAGNLVAYSLTKQNPDAKILLLEAGPGPGLRQDHINRFYANPIKTPNSPFPHSPDAPQPMTPINNDWRDPSTNYLVQTGSVPFGSVYARLGGGTTWHWLGTCIRELPSDFRLHSEYGVKDAIDWAIDYEDLQPRDPTPERPSWYSLAERELGVSGDGAVWNDYLGAYRDPVDYPMPKIPQSTVDQFFIDGLRGVTVAGEVLDVMPTPQARNSVPGYDDRPQCMGNTSCVPICPIQAKYDATVHLTKALRQGATLQTHSVAHQVIVEPGQREVSGVRYKRWDGTEGVATGKIYVLAAHAMETPKILLMSPWTDANGKRGTVANSSGQVGLNLTDHVCNVMWGLAPEPIHPFRGPLSTSGIGNFRDGPFRSEFAAFRIEIGNTGWNWPAGSPNSDVTDLVSTQGLFGAELRGALLDKVSRSFRIALEAESVSDSNSYVRPSPTYKDALGIPRPEVHYELSAYTKDGYAKSTQVGAAIFSALGVVDYTAVDSNAPGFFNWKGRQYQFRGAGHVLGTCRMGRDASNSVVNGDQQSWDHPNLFILGSATFPTTGTANPTLTIAALALRAAATIATQLRAD